MSDRDARLDRRQFVQGAVAAGIGACVVSGTASALGQETGAAAGAYAGPVIDVHSHVLPRCYLDGLAADGIFPVDEDGFPTPDWSEEAHLEFVDSVGIDYSVLSLSTPHIHHGDDARALELARQINDATGAMCGEHPERFGFAACLPLPYVEGSIEEAERCYDELSAIAVKVPSNANGVYLGDPSLDPVFERLDARGAVVIIHPSRPQAVPEGAFSSGPAPLLEYIVDTTRAVLNMFANATLDKFPNVKFVVPHCGSFLPEVVHRLVGMSAVLVPAGLMEPIDVLECTKKLYFDIAGVAQPVMLQALLKIADPSHLLYGSDYPYTPTAQIGKGLEGLKSDPLLAGIEADVFRGNAARLFGL